jgi:hypothetical protein
MNPPITIQARTNNLDKCELLVAGRDGVAVAVTIPSDGNVYQGLHRAAPELERVVNDILAAHGITAPEPASTEVPPSAPSEVTPES